MKISLKKRKKRKLTASGANELEDVMGVHEMVNRVNIPAELEPGGRLICGVCMGEWETLHECVEMHGTCALG
jgi:hypothetical protein